MRGRVPRAARAAQSGQSRQGLRRAARHAGMPRRMGAIHRRRSFLAHRRTGEAVAGRRAGRRAGSPGLARARPAPDRRAPIVFPRKRRKALQPGMRLATGLPFHDTQCGFKLFETRAAHEIFRRQLLDGFGFDVEVLFIGRRLGYREIEVPVKWNDVAGTKMTALARAWRRFWNPGRCAGTRSGGVIPDRWFQFDLCYIRQRWLVPQCLPYPGSRSSSFAASAANLPAGLR